MTMCSYWAHLWVLSRLLGPVTSLGSSLNDRYSPWTSGQLGKAAGPARDRNPVRDDVTHVTAWSRVT